MSANAAVQAVYDADRRLVILRSLMDFGDALNSSTLTPALHAWGFRTVDHAMVLDDLRWLKQRDLVALEDLYRDVVMATLTNRGERVARGEERVEGVARPNRG